MLPDSTHKRVYGYYRDNENKNKNSIAADLCGANGKLEIYILFVEGIERENILLALVFT